MDENDKENNEFQVFKDVIEAEDLEEQIRMTKQLSTLAKHLGEDRTRKELVPFILENFDFHHEILYNLGEQLGQLIPLMGGYEHSQPILELLRKLCTIDETIVRHKTVDILKNIVMKLDGELTEKLFMPVLDGLASEEWFPGKCSAAALIPALYLKVKEETQVDLRYGFRVLVQDESPIVRREAAMCLVDLIGILDKECLVNEFVPVFHNISNDPMDSVKTMLMNIAIALCRRLTEKEIEEFVFKTIESCVESSSWKVRHMLAHHIGEVQEVIPFGKTRGKILGIYQKLIDDMVEEVRTKAVESLSSYCQHLKSSYESSNDNNFEAVFQQSLAPHLRRLAGDPSDIVRLALSSNIPLISGLLGEGCFKTNLMPVIEHILDQETCMGVQENLLQSLYNLPSYVDLTDSLLSIRVVVRRLIVDSQASWRTRRSLLVVFMHIARTASKKYFSENLKILYATLLGDPVFAVRKTAPVILPLLAKRYGMGWADRELVQFFRMFTKDSRYLYRYIPLFGINELVKPSVRQGLEEEYLGGLKQLALSGDDAVKDKVAQALTRITKLVTTLKNKLEEAIYKDILSLDKSIDCSNENIALYADECVATLKKNCSCDIFAIDLDSLDQQLYLDGLLALIIREYLQILVELFDDPIVNVQVRAIQALSNIKEFICRVEEELGAAWVSEAMLVLSAEEKERIGSLVEAELNREKSEGVEDIDTEMMEDDVLLVLPEIKVEAVESKSGEEAEEIVKEQREGESQKVLAIEGAVEDDGFLVEEQKRDECQELDQKPPFEGAVEEGAIVVDKQKEDGAKME